VGEVTTDGSSNVLVWCTLNRNLSRWGQSRQCSVLHGVVGDLVASLAITKIGERHAAYRGGRNGLPHARALSEAVGVGGVGTTSMA
jgi:hypothetical protein